MATNTKQDNISFGEKRKGDALALANLIYDIWQEKKIKDSEANYKKIKVSDKLQAKIERHYGATRGILNHYKIEQKLDNPLIEYSRYVLGAGTENEKTTLARGIKQKLKIRNGKLGFESLH